MLQADDEDDAMDQQMKGPFGSSFRTFDATDYKPISKASLPLTVGQTQFIYWGWGSSLISRIDLIPIHKVLIRFDSILTPTFRNIIISLSLSLQIFLQ